MAQFKLSLILLYSTHFTRERGRRKNDSIVSIEKSERERERGIRTRTVLIINSHTLLSLLCMSALLSFFAPVDIVHVNCKYDSLMSCLGSGD